MQTAFTVPDFQHSRAKHCLHTAGVTGSIPVSPTIPFKHLAGNRAACGRFTEPVDSGIVPRFLPPVDTRCGVAALYVETDGCYFGLDGVDPWDEARDARKYDGPWPVIAHPPCQRWGKLWAGQPLWIKRTGQRKKKGDDGGCFAAALNAVRRYGGVLEHPWGSHAWPHFGLNVPPRKGGWITADFEGGWTCCVEQGRYGHYARKPTLLYAVGTDLPDLDWGKSDPKFPQWAIDKHGLAYCKRAGELAFQGGGTDSKPRIGTPVEFRDLLISMARSVVTNSGSGSISDAGLVTPRCVGTGGAHG